jgi:transposase
VARTTIFHVKLKEEERDGLNRYIRYGESSARSLTRARILLLADEGQSDAEVVNALKVSRTTVVRVRKRYCEHGLEFALTEKPRCGAPPKIDARVEAKLTGLACSNPPEGRSRWTMNLLADKLVELGEVDSISGMSVCRALKKMRLSHGSNSDGA